MMLDEDRAVAPLLASPFNESNPAVPDGAWIAYRSDESGRNEVYVDRFPDLGDRRVQVSDRRRHVATLVARRNRALLPRGPRDDRGPRDLGAGTRGGGLTKQVGAVADWTVVAITDRQKRLAQIAVTTWAL